MNENAQAERYDDDPETRRYWHERCLPTPREYEIDIAALAGRDIDTIPFTLTEEEKAEYARTRARSDEYERKHGHRQLPRLLND